MPPKSPCTEIPIQNANISTLDPHNCFFGFVLLHQILGNVFPTKTWPRAKALGIVISFQNLAKNSLSPLYTNTSPKASAYKLEYSNLIAKLATPVDDPVFIELQAKYFGAILFDNETRASQKLFRIAAIQFVRSYSSNRHSCWEATCEPVYRLLRRVPCSRRPQSSWIKCTSSNCVARLRFDRVP
jgi:hypothetical protein